MIKKYNRNEFIVNGIEIRKIDYYKDWYNNDTCFEYVIESMEAYKNEEQIDVADDSIITDELWDIITNELNKQLN